MENKVGYYVSGPASIQVIYLKDNDPNTIAITVDREETVHVNFDNDCLVITGRGTGVILVLPIKNLISLYSQRM